MEQNFATLLEIFGHKRSIILSISLPDPDKLKQSKPTDQEIKKILL